MSKLTWSEQFALIDTYKPTDEQVVKAFNITQAELNTARALRAAGTITASKEIDTASYGDVFVAGDSSDTATSTKSGIVRPGVKSVAKTVTKTPETATKRVVAPKKRGRKGTKIQEAFKSIPAAPVPVEEFAKQYGVSIPVLRQSKRFDTSPDLGEVRVKVSKDTGKLMIWREASAS
jgi:hypothetical protein